MVVSQKDDFISPEHYLEGEKVSPIKHEYMRGQVYAMAGASDVHVTAGNMFALLKNHLRGSRCRVYMVDMKAYIKPLDIYYYIDESPFLVGSFAIKLERLCVELL